MPQRWVIGLASGSSLDGVDAALLELGGVGLEMQVVQFAGLHQPYPPELRDMIRRASDGGTCDIRQVCRLHRLMGETFAGAARAAADGASLALSRVQVIGCSGHTVARESEGRFPSSLSLGMDAVIAERTGVSVVGDFRARDLAAGGNGAPLATLPDHILLRHPRESRLLVHLGGISRIVYLPAAARPSEAFSVEAGPCNLVLDTLIRHLTGGREGFDAGGKHAVQGRCIDPLVQTWLSHPALQRRPPRFLPRHAWGEEFATNAVQQLRQQQGSLHDLLCTATHFVARCITTAVKRFLPARARIDRVLLSGGGVRNGFLWQLLGQQFDGLPLARTDEAGIPAELRKPIVSGILAALTLDGVPGNSPGATGAAGSRLLGSLTPGSSGNWGKCLQWMAQQAAPVLVG